MCQLPFHILKKVLVLQDDSHVPFSIDEDGYGSCIIENYEVHFQVNEYCEILVESITCSKVTS